MWHISSYVSPSGGAWAVFFSVFATQIGIPVPAAPMLIIAGTMVGLGQGSFAQMLFAAVVAALGADTCWFLAGRKFGRTLINRLVRFSLSIDTTLRAAQNQFERFGPALLAISKFIPGMGLVSPPLMGSTSVALNTFLIWDCLGAALWASFWLIGGAAFRGEVVALAAQVESNGGTVLELLIGMALLVLGYRWVRRLQFRHWLAQVRISPDQLAELMSSGTPPIIFDARPEAVRRSEAVRIRGALPLDLNSPVKVDESLLGLPIVVYCVCPNEASAKRIVRQLHRKGIHHVHALKGGLDAWQASGFPTETIVAAAQERARCDQAGAGDAGPAPR